MDLSVDFSRLKIVRRTERPWPSS